MDEFAAETRVEWREWGPEAFAVARRRGVPLLLCLTVPWSPECREMDRRTYAEPRIAANVNDGFVPVRVDADRRPTVRERYNTGGFPSTVFLTPDGEVLSGATYLGPDGFRSVLDRVRETWDAKGASAGSVPRAVRNARPPAGEVTARIEEGMIEQLLGAFDDEFGGWGTDAKFPLPRTVEFALVRARDQATRTLDAVHAHLLDTADGGFFRYAARRDWTGARREKLTDENAALVRAFARAYRYTGDDSHREAAGRAVDYLTTTLWVPDPSARGGDGDTDGGSRGAFAASQAGDEEYHRLEPAERAEADPPYVDRTALADRNGLAIDGLLTLARYVDDERPRRYAERARAYLVEELVEDGTVARYADPDAPEGLLVDQARVLRGLATSWEVTGEAGPARAVADRTLGTLVDDGAVRDAPADAEAAGLCDRPIYPIDPTIDLADALVDLAALTGADRYRAAAHDAVAASAGATERMGVQVAGFAAVAARLREPRAVAVGRPAGSDLHRAALRLADHETTVVPDADVDGAVLRVDGERAGDAGSPAALEALLTD